MKLKLHYLVVNNGDGSASVEFFSSAKKLEEYESKEDAPFCDGGGTLTITANEVDGIEIDKEVDPVHYKDE